MANIKIVRKNAKPFTSDSGDEVPYFWYKGQEEGKTTVIEIGSTSKHEEGETVDMLLEERKRPNGRIWYSEVQ